MIYWIMSLLEGMWKWKATAKPALVAVRVVTTTHHERTTACWSTTPWKQWVCSPAGRTSRACELRCTRLSSGPCCPPSPPPRPMLRVRLHVVSLALSDFGAR